MTDRPHAACEVAPGRVLVAGDWHGNRYWALNVIHRVPRLLAGEQRPLILHVGDFGVWPDDEGRRYLAAVSTALSQVGAELWFVDGNHEEITREQEAAIIGGGPADVMACHDCPAAVPHAFPPPPPEWSPADLARNDAHRIRLQRIVDAVRPAHLMHGHLHRAYQRTCDFGYGPGQVTGLRADRSMRNFAVLDVTSMEWASRRPRALAFLTSALRFR